MYSIKAILSITTGLNLTDSEEVQKLSDDLVKSYQITKLFPKHNSTTQEIQWWLKERILMDHPIFVDLTEIIIEYSRIYEEAQFQEKVEILIQDFTRRWGSFFSLII